jgi:hypothetical protein
MVLERLVVVVIISLLGVESARMSNHLVIIMTMTVVAD